VSGLAFESTAVAESRRATASVVVAVLAVLLLHVGTSWGYVGLYWGDTGRWLYEVDRFAHGARLYRDVYWGFPPLGMWLVGGAARVIGSDLTQIWIIMTAVAVVLAVSYAFIVAQILPLPLAAVTGATGMALGAIYSSDFSAPLVSGMYSPAVPVAVMFAFAQLALFIRQWNRPSLTGAAVVGALGGAGILTKHDVWIACTLMTVITAFFAPTGPISRRGRATAATLGFVAVVAAGLLILVALNGASALPSIFSGYGQLDELAGVNLPNLSQLCIELAALGTAAVVFGTISWATGTWRSRKALLLVVSGAALALLALAWWMVEAEIVARHVLTVGKDQMAAPFERLLSPFAGELAPRLQRAFSAFRLVLVRHLIPITVPTALLVMGFVRRKQLADVPRFRLLMFLLLIAISLRARRMISYAEWSVLMLEVPICALALVTFMQVHDRRERAVFRAVSLGCIVLLMCGLFAHWRFGYGFATRRGVFPVTQTARGGARIGPGLSADFRYVRDLTLIADPTGKRPLLSYGYSAGHNYLLGRPGVGALTHGFRISVYPTPDSAYRVARAEHDRLILIDNPAYSDANPSTQLRPFRWQPRMVVNPYLRVDRPLFVALAQGCRKVTAPDRRSGLVIYDCAVGDSAGPAR
jgi:hypothetical protein